LSILRIETPRAFVPLLAPARYKGARGGRGSGKSHFFAGNAVRRCIERSGTRIVCVREVQKSLKESVKLLIEDKIGKFGVGPMFNVKHDEIVTPGGGLILFQGMQDHSAESIKSLEGFDIAYIEEAQTLSKRSLEMLRPTIRKPGSEIWGSWNPRKPDDPIDALLCGSALPPGAIVVKANYSDNPWFPAELEAERAYDEVHARDRYAHIWLGDYEPAVVGAIWDRATIGAGRRTDEQVPVLERIVVAVDPAVSAEEKSNETGIVVAGIGDDQHGYILDDLSTAGSPRHWAERAIAAMDLHEADAIVIEVNQGGDMCRQTLKSVRSTVRIIEVRATRGKHVRAEPISALYALGRVHHVGTFPELEDQMCLMTAAGYEGEGSPDRLDAAVWALTELFPRMTRKPIRGDRPTRANAGYDPHRAMSRR
jgi:phage terminase large subunit-like protein